MLNDFDTFPCQAASKTWEYCSATAGSLNTRTWFEFTYRPVNEKLVEPVSTFTAPEGPETMNTLSWA